VNPPTEARRPRQTVVRKGSLTERLTAAYKAWLPDVRRPPADDAPIRRESIRRLGGIVGLVYMGLTGALIKAATVMTLPDEKLEAKARVQFEDTHLVFGRRGDLFDRNGALLATTVDLFELRVNPALINAEVPLAQSDKERRAQGTAPLQDPALALAQALAPLLPNTTEAVLYERLSRANRQDERLATDLTPADVARVRAAVRELSKQDRRLRGNAVRFHDQPKRFYPGREDLAPLLGLVGPDGQGAAGIEQTLDHELRGEIFKYIRWRDRKNRAISADQRAPKAGHSVLLTIDRRIQHVAETAIETAMVETGAEAAWAVVVDVHTGEILALANKPTVNLNDRERIDFSKVKNRAMLDAIEPGSVFKPFIAAAALEEGLHTPESLIDCEGGAWAIGRKVIHDDHPRGVVSLTDVIKYSSNIGSAKLALELGADRSLDYLKRFGFTRESGLKVPGETRGTMRSAKDIKPIELATTAYGHGVTANAVQLASAFAALGNDGVRMEPRLYLAVRDAEGQLIERFAPQAEEQIVSAETARATVTMMESVVGEGGTGTRAAVPGYSVAGKTGTAWKHVGTGYSETARIGSFVGLIPADRPRLAIAVVVDTPTIGSSYGGIVAAPAFATIGGEAMRILGVDPDPALLPTPKTKKSATGASDAPPTRVVGDRALTWTGDGRLRAPDLGGLSLRDALGAISASGLQVNAAGSGRVATQSPPPGTPLAPGDAISIHLQ
jgi:cell division protein FtsI (penicillin-binding protein 3)